MAIKYEYTKTPVDIGRLSYDILEESGIVTTLLYCNFSEPTKLEVYFDSDLSGSEQSLLDAIVENHSGVPLPEPAYLPTGDVPNDMITISNGTGVATWVDISDVIYGVLGVNEYEISNEDISSTTSTSYQEKISLVVDNLTAGKYRLDWYYEWAYSDGNFQFKSRIQIDDTDTYMEQEVRPAQASTDKYRDSSGFVYVNLTSGSHHIDLDYCSSKNKKTAYIRRPRIALRRVA